MRIIVQDLAGKEYQVFKILPNMLFIVTRNDEELRYNTPDEYFEIVEELIKTGIKFKSIRR